MSSITRISCVTDNLELFFCRRPIKTYFVYGSHSKGPFWYYVNIKTISISSLFKRQCNGLPSIEKTLDVQKILRRFFFRPHKKHFLTRESFKNFLFLENFSKFSVYQEHFCMKCLKP